MGIDPAPAKKTVVWCEGEPPRLLPPREVRAYLEGRLAAGARLLVTWDSPLTFDVAFGFSDRPIDRAVRQWVKQQQNAGLIAPKAVSVLPFAGCPHWAVSCHALGMPFGSPVVGLELCGDTFVLPNEGEGLVAEVHPAVALAVWWTEAGMTEPFPRYKRDAPACVAIAQALGFPQEAGVNDDILDAYVGWRLGIAFVESRAVRLGTAQAGGYLLPDGPSVTAIRDCLATRRGASPGRVPQRHQLPR